MSSAVINVSKVSSMDTSMFTNNRSKLLKLAEGIKTKKKASNNKKGVNFKKEPGYANIEHLVFGTYRSKNSPNNLNINTENRANISPSESVITVNSSNSNSADALVGINSRTSTLVQESLSQCHSPQSIYESQAEERRKSSFEKASLSVEENFIERPGGFTQANAVLQKLSSPLSVSKSRIPLTSENIDLLEDDSKIFLQTVEDLFPDPPSTTLCSDLCSPRTRHKLVENGYHYQVEHANVTRNKSAESTVHSPPVHLLPQNKYITHEFSADFLTPEMPVAASKTSPSFKKLQVQGTVVTVAPSRLCSNTTQSSTRSKPPRAITNTASKSANNSTSRLGDVVKDVEKSNIQTYRDKISNASASVRLTNNAKMSGAFKRLSSARSSSTAISNGRYSSPPRTMNADEPFSSTCTNRRQSNLKTKCALNDESTMGTSSHFKESESRALPPPSPPLRFCSQKESDLRQQDISSAKLAEAYSSSRLRKVSGIDTIAVADEGENSNALIGDAFITAHINSSRQLAPDDFHNKHDNPASPKLLLHTNSDPVVSLSNPVNNPSLATLVKTMPKVSVSTTNPARPTVSTHVKITVSKDEVGKTNANQGTKAEMNNKKNGYLKPKTGPKPSSQEQIKSIASFGKTNGVSQKTSANIKPVANLSTAANKNVTRPRITSVPSSAVSNLMVRGRSSSAVSLNAGRKMGSSSSLAGSQVSLCSTTNIRAANGRGKTNDSNIRRSFHSAANSVGGRDNNLAKSTSSMRSTPSSNISGRNLLKHNISSIGKPPVYPPAKGSEKPKPTLVQNNGGNNRAKTPIANNNLKNGITKPLPVVSKGLNKRPTNYNNLSSKQNISNCQSTLILPVENEDFSLETAKPENVLDLASNILNISDYGCPLNLELPKCLTVIENEVDNSSAKATAASLDKLLADLAAESGPDLAVNQHDQILYCQTGTTSNCDSLEKFKSVPEKDLITRRSISLPGVMLSPTRVNLPTNTSLTGDILTGSSKPLHPARSISVSGPSYSYFNDRNMAYGNELKDFAIPHQEISHSSPSTNVSRSSSCNDRVKDELRSCQSNGQKVSVSSSVPLKKSWYLVEDDKNVSDFHQENVPDVNEQNIVRPSKFSYDNIDVISTILDEPCAIDKHLQNTETKSLKERNIPKCVRRVKAASSPSFSDTRTDSWVSEGDLRRPWSQICSEQDVERLADGRSCRVGSMATGIDSIVQLQSSITDLASESESVSAVSSTPSSSSGSSHGNTFGGRFASMRTPNSRPPGAPAEGVIQKFRKSFSARFYKKVKGESPPLPSNGTISARYASFSSYLNDQLESDSAVIDLSSNDIANIDTGKTDSATLFKLGPLVWRSSKEKKGKKLKKLSIGGETINCDQNENVDKDNFESQNKSGVSVGSTVTLINHPHPNGFPPGISVVSPRLFSRRAHSTSLRSERPKRPLSEQTSSLYGSINLSDITKNGLPPKIVVRREKKFSNSRWSRERSNLRRSISQPLEIEKLSAMGLSHCPGGLSDHEDHYLSSASSDEEIDSETEWNGSYTNKLQKNGNFYFEYSEPVMYAEALWDHVTLDSEELPFKAGELVEVLDKSDSEWWWGIKGNQAGWFPASFVRIRVNQEDADEDCFQKLKNGNVYSPNNRKMPMSTDEIRTKVIMEIFNTEQDYVQHLSDVCEGYLKHVRKRPDMFSEERLNIIFGNVEQLYTFHNLFVTELEQCINRENPHLSEIGSCFIKHKEGFEIYSEFCNNHPQAVNELQQLYPIPKYAQFFEACRLLRGMIDIALDGFLLTPVQRICKYPLQLQELLKYTKTDHPDYHNVEKALKTMGNVAHYINERKRRMEGLEKLAEWQTEVEDWQGCDLLDHSSQLIYSGDVYKVTTAWSREFKLFLFDHQLIICKKDLLKKQSYTYKNRISVDHCEIRDIIDGKDVHSGISLKYAWKVYCAERSKWYTFATRTAEEKNKWMQAFNDERKRVAGDKINGFVVSEKAKKMAAMVIHNKKKPKKPKDKENKDFNRRMSRPEARSITSKSGSLPSNVAFNVNKKKTSSGWFHFGSNKKTKR